MGQLWTRAVGGHEDINQSPIAVAIRNNNSQEVHNYCFGLLIFLMSILILVNFKFRWVDFLRKVSLKKRRSLCFAWLPGSKSLAVDIISYG